MSDTEQLVLDALRTEPSDAQYTQSLARLSDRNTLRLLHVAMGLCTEAGEFVDQLKKHIFYGKTLDKVNLVEELGDTSWYERIGTNILEVKFIDMLEKNVAKLKARFPEKFSEDNALNRNLTAERHILE